MQPDELCQYTYDPALVAYRHAAAQRRAEAFCPGRDTVLGQPVLPLTARTYSLLFAIGSPFLHGGPVREADVATYLWFHSRWFTVRPRLARFAKWISLLRFRSRLRGAFVPRRAFVDRYAALLALAITDIEHLAARAFADAPPAGGRPGAPISTLEAQFIHSFAAAYGWSPRRTRSTPLARLFQLDRCQANAHGADVLDQGELALRERRLRARNAELAASRAASSPPPLASSLQPLASSL